MPKLNLNDNIVIDYSEDGWSEFVKWLDGTYGALKYIWGEDDNTYTIAAIDEIVYRTISINKQEATDFVTLYKKNNTLTAVSKKNHKLYEIYPPSSSRVDIPSINWCDKRTWYVNSIRTENEILVDSGDGLLFKPNISKTWIDVTHGRITGEKFLRSEYEPVITVDDVIVAEHPPGTTNGDYGINYLTGDVTFVNSQGGKVVKASYSEENGSLWVLAPQVGKNLVLTTVEVQFSENLEINDTVIFQAYGLVDVFAPYLIPSVPSGTKIPIGKPTIYQTLMDYINEAAGSYPTIPIMGGNSWRGNKHPIQIFRWPYYERGTTDLISAYGMEIRIQLENDIPFSGEDGVAVATFYAISEDG